MLQKPFARLICRAECLLPMICDFLEEKCPSGNPVIWPIMAKGLRLPVTLPQKVLNNWRHLIHLWTLSFSELACCVRSRKLDESLERFSIFCFSAFLLFTFPSWGSTSFKWQNILNFMWGLHCTLESVSTQKSTTFHFRHVTFKNNKIGDTNRPTVNISGHINELRDCLIWRLIGWS